MSAFYTLTHILKELQKERIKLIKEGKLKKSGRSKFPVNRNSIVKLEKAGIIDTPMVTQVHAQRIDRLYNSKEVEKIIAQVTKYAISKP